MSVPACEPRARLRVARAIETGGLVFMRGILVADGPVGPVPVAMAIAVIVCHWSPRSPPPGERYPPPSPSASASAFARIASM